MGGSIWRGLTLIDCPVLGLQVACGEQHPVAIGAYIDQIRDPVGIIDVDRGIQVQCDRAGYFKVLVESLGLIVQTVDSRVFVGRRLGK